MKIAYYEIAYCFNWACCCIGRHGSPAHRSLSSYAPAPPTAGDCA